MLSKIILVALVGLAASASVHHERPEEHHDPNHHLHHNDGLLHVNDHFIVHDEKEEDQPQDKQAYAVNYCAQYYWPTGTYPYPNDCRKYISCANGITNVMNCPATTVYNPNIRVCDSAANVPYCNYNAPAGVNGFYFNNYCQVNNYGNGVYFHPYDCNSYINCNYGQTQVNVCPAGSVYDNTQRACIGFQGVVRPNNNPWCSQYVFQNPVYPVNPVNPVYNNYCAQVGLTNGVHPDPANCYGYIQCSFGQTVHQQCPAGLSFDVNLLVCDDQRYNNCNGAGLIGVGKK